MGVVGVAALLVQFAQNLAFAHSPNDSGRSWSCIGDNDGSNSTCFMHWATVTSPFVHWYFGFNNQVPSTWWPAIRLAASNWNGAGGSVLSVQENATGTTVYIRTSNSVCAPGQIGCATPTMDLAAKHVVGGGATLVTNPGAGGWYIDLGAPGGSQYDLASAAAHELGHLFAGGHSNTDATAVMWGVLNQGGSKRFPNFWDGTGPCQSYGHSHGLWGSCACAK